MAESIWFFSDSHSAKEFTYVGNTKTIQFKLKKGIINSSPFVDESFGLDVLLWSEYTRRSPEDVRLLLELEGSSSTIQFDILIFRIQLKDKRPKEYYSV